jgi:hypothetical protein
MNFGLNGVIIWTRINWGEITIISMVLALAIFLIFRKKK